MIQNMRRTFNPFNKNEQNKQSLNRIRNGRRALIFAAVLFFLALLGTAYSLYQNVFLNTQGGISSRLYITYLTRPLLPAIIFFLLYLHSFRNPRIAFGFGLGITAVGLIWSLVNLAFIGMLAAAFLLRYLHVAYLASSRAKQERTFDDILDADL